MKTITITLPKTYRNSHIAFSSPCAYKSQQGICALPCKDYGFCLVEQELWWKTYRNLGIQKLEDMGRYDGKKSLLQNLTLLTSAEKIMLSLLCDSKVILLRVGEKMRRTPFDFRAGSRSDRIMTDIERRLDKFFDGQLSKEKPQTIEEVMRV